MVPPLDFLCVDPLFNVGVRGHGGKIFIETDELAGVRPYQKIIELLTMTADDVIAALAMVTAMLIGMRLLYGAWPWENRKTWYRTKSFVPVMPLPKQINNQAEDAPADTDTDHFDRKLMPAE